MTDLQKAKWYLDNLYIELDELLDSGEPEDSPDVEMLACAIDDAQLEYDRLVDLETDAALAECEKFMEMGLDIF